MTKKKQGPGNKANVAIAFSHNGQHYPGFTLHEGVSMTESGKPFPCKPNQTAYDFTNCVEDMSQTFIDRDIRINVEVGEIANHHYLQLRPVKSPEQLAAEAAAKTS